MASNHSKRHDLWIQCFLVIYTFAELTVTYSQKLYIFKNDRTASVVLAMMIGFDAELCLFCYICF
jgi:hypothetical protein